MSLPVATAITGIDSMDVLHCRNFFKNTAMMGGLLFIAATQSQPTLLPRTARSNGRGCTVKRRGFSRFRTCVLISNAYRLD